MEQATQPTRPTGSPETILPGPDRAAYQHAARVRDEIVSHLTTVPRSDAVIGDPQGFMVRLNFGINDRRGVDELGELCGLAPTVVAFGHWYEIRATVDDVQVVAEVLIDPATTTTDATPPAPTAAAEETDPTSTAPAPADEETDPDTIGIRTAPAVLPLGSSVTFAPGVTTTPHTTDAPAGGQ
ncbi:hypothetical protein [Streptomyces sp. DSM 40484]|uniref:hypothetical protein n=1 Tax=Streptomyces kroppenstedtii TaxID=3051181 RepID=UPI0028D242BD|nr:hypothetical protein [Streptomyces sp. DSM 40484]